MMSAAASMGMVHQWDIDDGFSALDKFLYVDDVNIKAGGILGIGVCNSGVYVNISLSLSLPLPAPTHIYIHTHTHQLTHRYNTDIDAAIGVLPEHLERDSAYKRDENTLLNCSAILALGLSYAGSARDDVMELLIDFASEDVEDDASEQENDPRVHIAALALGMIFVGTGEDECAQPMIERLLQCSEDELSKPENRLYALGLSLIYLGCEEGADVAQDILSTLPHKTFRDFALLTLKACAYTGSGNVLKVQEMLHACAEHIQEQDKSYHQAAAVLGIAMITMGEEVGGNMAMRTSLSLPLQCPFPP
jgi:26S proteasome regulatory subunit N1